MPRTSPLCPRGCPAGTPGPPPPLCRERQGRAVPLKKVPVPCPVPTSVSVPPGASEGWSGSGCRPRVGQLPRPEPELARCRAFQKNPLLSPALPPSPSRRRGAGWAVGWRLAPSSQSLLCTSLHCVGQGLSPRVWTEILRQDLSIVGWPAALRSLEIRAGMAESRISGSPKPSGEQLCRAGIRHLLQEASLRARGLSQVLPATLLACLLCGRENSLQFQPVAATGMCLGTVCREHG